MQLQQTFDALVPYFVYRTVMEQELEEKRLAVAQAQQSVRVAKKEYHRAMDYLEEISLDIQRAESARKKAEAEEAEAAEGGGEAGAAKSDGGADETSLSAAGEATRLSGAGGGEGEDVEAWAGEDAKKAEEVLC